MQSSVYRFLPDKANDLVEEAASALHLAQENKPDELESLDREIMTLEIERESLKNETDVFSTGRHQKIEETLARKRLLAEQLTQVWHAERARLDRIKDVKERLEAARRELEIAQRQGQYECTSRLRFATIPELEKQLPAESSGERGESEDAEGPLAMLHDRVTSADIARVVAKAAGRAIFKAKLPEPDPQINPGAPVDFSAWGLDDATAAFGMQLGQSAVAAGLSTVEAVYNLRVNLFLAATEPCTTS